MSKGVLERIEEKLDNVLELLAKTGKASPAKESDEDEDSDDEDEKEEKAAEKPATRKRTRTPNKPKAPSATDVKEKLKAVLDKKGRKAALAILEKFDAEKIGDLEEDQYADFVKACEKALGAGDEDEDDDDLDL